MKGCERKLQYKPAVLIWRPTFDEPRPHANLYAVMPELARLRQLADVPIAQHVVLWQHHQHIVVLLLHCSP